MAVPQITDFEIMETGWGGDDKFGADDKAVVRVTFKNAGEEPMISFRFQQWKSTPWKIDDIRHPNSDNLLLKELLLGAARSSHLETGGRCAGPCVRGIDLLSNEFRSLRPLWMAAASVQLLSTRSPLESSSIDAAP